MSSLFFEPGFAQTKFWGGGGKKRKKRGKMSTTFLFDKKREKEREGQAVDP